MTMAFDLSKHLHSIDDCLDGGVLEGIERSIFYPSPMASCTAGRSLVSNGYIVSHCLSRRQNCT